MHIKTSGNQGRPGQGFQFSAQLIGWSHSLTDYLLHCLKLLTLSLLLQSPKLIGSCDGFRHITGTHIDPMVATSVADRFVEVAFSFSLFPIHVCHIFLDDPNRAGVNGGYYHDGLVPKHLRDFCRVDFVE